MTALKWLIFCLVLATAIIGLNWVNAGNTGTLNFGRLRQIIHPNGEIFLNGAQLAGGNGQPIILKYNPSAINPTYSEMIDFLRRDETDRHIYISGYYVCADFAQDLYNSAQSNGIKCGYVVLDGLDHAIDVFDTTDRGLVYIDDTGSEGISTPSDKIAHVQIGSPLTVEGIDTTGRWIVPASPVTGIRVFWK